MGSVRDSATGAGNRRHVAGRAGTKAEEGGVSEENLTYLRIVERVTGSGITQIELGAAVGASVRSVQNWAAGEAVPRGRSRDRLLDVKYVVDELREVYTDEGIAIWLHARNRNLDGNRPIDLLTAGEVDRVVDEAQRISEAM